jgi:CRISPR-associated endoribonuclease Cas6
MFVSLVAELEITKPVSIPLTHGEEMRGALFQALKTVDPHRAAALHGDRDGELRAYTVSPIQSGAGAHHGHLLLRPGDDCWFRVTGVTGQVSDLLLAMSEHCREWKVFGRAFRARFDIRRWCLFSGEHPWAGAVSLDELCTSAVQAARMEPDRIHLEFHSPTAFERKSASDWGNWRHLPEHTLVFGSIRDHLEAFCPELARPPERIDILEGCLALGRYNSKSHMLSFALRNNKKRYCFTGEAEYLINPAVVADAGDKLLWLHMLAAFVFYSGCGVDTSAGMGQVRRIPSSN